MCNCQDPCASCRAPSCCESILAALKNLFALPCGGCGCGCGCACVDVYYAQQYALCPNGQNASFGASGGGCCR